MNSARRVLPTDPKDFLRSIVPLALVALGIVERGATLIALALIVLGTAVAIQRRAPVRWAWAGAVPVAALPLLPESGILGWITSACADLDRGMVLPALARGGIVVAIVFALALVLQADRGGIGVRWPARRYVGWILPAFLTGVVAAFGSWMWLRGGASPFPWGLQALASDPVGLVYASVYGAASAIAIELTFRGVLQAWSARVIGLVPAVLGQAAIAALPSVVAVGAGESPMWIGWTFGVAALLGLVAARTRSLAIPIAAQTGMHIGFYVAIACP